MARWETLTLRRAGVALIDCVHATPSAVDAGYPYIGIPQMKDGRLDFDGARKISGADFAKWTIKARPRVHDIVLSRRTNPGVIAPVRDETPFALGQNLVLLRANGERVSPAFLRWLVSGPSWWEQIAKFINVGAVFDSLRCADVPNFELPIPPIREQDAIAELLTALDDKIELNRRMNETLEAQARALFRDWFVDFGPVKANMAGAAPYLAPDLWSLFPDRLDDDGVPEGWKWIPASKLFEIRIGRTPPRKQTEHFVDGAEGVPWLSIKTMGGGDIYIFDTEESLTPESVERFNVPSVRKGTVLLSFKLTVGRVAIAGCDMTTNEAIAHFNETPTSPPSAFTYSFLKQFDYQRLGSTSSIATAVNSQTIKSIEFPCPGDCLLKAFDELAAPLLEKIKSNTSESRTLAQIRDLLLPKLMSGEIRIGDVERELESA